MKNIHVLIAVVIGFTVSGIFGQNSPDFTNGVNMGEKRERIVEP